MPDNANKDSLDAMSTIYARIYAQVNAIPSGRVSTYGRIAKLVGGCNPRQVGYAMAHLPPGSAIPWQRVINSKGEISPRKEKRGSKADNSQRQLLAAEGVIFNARDRIDLRRFGWPE